MYKLFFHTKFHPIVREDGSIIEETEEIKTTVSLTVSKQDIVMETTTREFTSSIPKFPRITFCGVVSNKVDGETNVIYIGASKVSPNDTFIKKKGRSIAYHRAVEEPIAFVECPKDHAHIIFLEACKMLEANIRNGGPVWSDKPVEINLNVDEILAEQSPD